MTDFKDNFFTDYKKRLRSLFKKKIYGDQQ